MCETEREATLLFQVGENREEEKEEEGEGEEEEGEEGEENGADKPSSGELGSVRTKFPEATTRTDSLEETDRTKPSRGN